MRNSSAQPRPGDIAEPDPREPVPDPVLDRRECESYAEECARLAAQCQSAELRRLLLRAASGWRWLAGVGYP